MSFKCQKCGRQQQDGVKPCNQMTEKRFVKYPEVERKDGRKYTPEGYEIIKELNVCENCYEKSKDDKIKIIGYKVVEGSLNEVYDSEKEEFELV